MRGCERVSPRLSIPFACTAAARAAASRRPEAQKSRIDAAGVSIPIDVREQYLGKTGSKTAVKFILSVNRTTCAGRGRAAALSPSCSRAS